MSNLFGGLAEIMLGDLQSLLNIVLALLIGEVIYDFLWRFVLKHFGEKLTGLSRGLFLLGAFLFGLIDFIGDSGIAAGLALCVLALLLDLLQDTIKRS